MNQRKVEAIYNDRTTPFHVDAGKLEQLEDGTVEKNYKVIDQFPTLESALTCVKDCQGYDFVDLLYVDAKGLVWDLALKPKLLDKE